MQVVQRVLLALVVLAVLPLAVAAEMSQQVAKTPHSPPNIVIILLDDIGFGNAGTFGGPAKTPFLDQFAMRGLRYNDFNTTGICSSTRAALLTGLNHHRVGFGTLADTPGRSIGYNTVWPASAISIAEVLHLNGYSTAAIGKWHDTPWKEISPVGPFTRWPTRLGFDYFYGFMEPGASSQWEPDTLYRGTMPVEPWGTPAQGYYLTTDLADDAIRWIQTHDSLAPDKPYFLYFATGAVHFPHHVPREWIEKYHGQFDQGWDEFREQVFARQKELGVIPVNAELTARPNTIPAWASLSPDQKKVYARQMEVYSAYIAYTDQEVGRLLQTVRQGSHADNTLIFYIVGDNGGSPGGWDGDWENQLRHIDGLGGPLYDNGINVGWGWASSTPFQWYKGIASHFGAVRDPLVVSWPARIKDDGRLRTQFVHVNDIAPTIYDVAGISYPSMVNGVKTKSLDGVSFAFTFDHPDAPSNHHKQYFAMFGNRAIYQDGWVAAARHVSVDFDHDSWELYHVAGDYSEAHDVASQYPRKLKALRTLFDSEAKRNNVYPLGGSGPPYSSPLTTGTFVYHQGLPRILALAAPVFLGSHRITADVTLPESDARGVILSYGGRWGGFVLYVKDGRLVYESNVRGEHHNVITSDVPLPHGKAVLAYEFTKGDQKKDGEDISVTGIGRLYINGQLAGEAKVDIDRRAAFWGTFGVGQAFGSPVSQTYQLPFKFSGSLDQVKVELK